MLKKTWRYKKHFEILERKNKCEGDEYNRLISYIKYKREKISELDVIK